MAVRFRPGAFHHSNRKVLMFTLNIATGNEAMQDPADIADALRRLADRLEAIHGWIGNGTIRDLNGNTVGSFALTVD